MNYNSVSIESILIIFYHIIIVIHIGVRPIGGGGGGFKEPFPGFRASNEKNIFGKRLQPPERNSSRTPMVI